jgi:hypothetical protein
VNILLGTKHTSRGKHPPICRFVRKYANGSSVKSAKSLASKAVNKKGRLEKELETEERKYVPRSRYYDHIFGVFVKKQCCKQIFAKTSSSLRKNAYIFAKIFGENF